MSTSDQDLVQYCRDVAENARKASAQLKLCSGELKNRWLNESAKALRDGSALTVAGAALSAEHFDPASLAETEDDNWMMYLTNLKRFSAALEDFCCAERWATSRQKRGCKS